MSKCTRQVSAVAAITLLILQLPVLAGANVEAVSITGTKCPRIGLTKKVKTSTYICKKTAKGNKWELQIKTGAASTTTTTTTPATPANGPCRSTSDITQRLPNALQTREWEKVVAELQPHLAGADTSGLTTAVIDTFEDNQIGNLLYGRYYPMNYPSVIPATQGKGCAYLAAVFDVFIRFTGSDKSDDAAKQGIQAAVKTLLYQFLLKHTKVDGYDVDVLLIEPLLDYCPGRTISFLRTMCPWNDWGFLYFPVSELTPEMIAKTAQSDIFSLSVKGATFPPRPFTQIVGIGSSDKPISKGSLSGFVPSSNKSHQASTYVEFGSDTLELGQTFIVETSLNVSSISLRTVGHIGTVDGRRVSGSGPAIPATIQTRIYKSSGSDGLPLSIRRSQLTSILDTTQTVSFPHDSEIRLDLAGTQTLKPGSYLVTFTISQWNPDGSYIRLEAFAEGASGQTDVYAGGKAYRACDRRTMIGYRQIDSPIAPWIGEEQTGRKCDYFYPNVSKGENPARPAQHTWVWADMAISLNP